MAAPLQVWVLSDQQPGHYNQSRGIITALEQVRPLQVHWLDLVLRMGLLRSPMRWWLNRGVPPPPAWLHVCYRLPRLPRTACDLIVSTGGKTSFANAWLARRLGARNIFAGSLRRLSDDLFDVVLTLPGFAPQASSQLRVELPPSPMDAPRLRQAGAELRRSLDDGHELWALMVGGDGAGFHYRKADWRALAELVNRAAAVFGIRWLFLTSRRTDRQVEQRLKAALNGSRLAAACWYHGGETAEVASFLGAADKVFVTEDSMTMLTEAIYTQKPVISLRPARAGPDWRYAGMLERFAAQGWIRREALATLAADVRRLRTADWRPLRVSPLDSLSRQLQERLKL